MSNASTKTPPEGGARIKPSRHRLGRHRPAQQRHGDHHQKILFRICFRRVNQSHSGPLVGTGWRWVYRYSYRANAQKQGIFRWLPISWRRVCKILRRRVPVALSQQSGNGEHEQANRQRRARPQLCRSGKTAQQSPKTEQHSYCDRVPPMTKLCWDIRIDTSPIE
jgi:hypothetical protein